MKVFYRHMKNAVIRSLAYYSLNYENEIAQCAYRGRIESIRNNGRNVRLEERSRAMALEISDVIECDVEECVFNTDKKCHTMAIMVGGPDPLCDTYMSGSKKSGSGDLFAKVGTCKIGQCKYNSEYECQAHGITVVPKGSKAFCGTYEL
ncbi:MAG: DUF1540 domain-containing protein [Chitinivibrionales bacterium]|nr:DUF1540 domain-containing protein [Chitinivibrionales bacterium]